MSTEVDLDLGVNKSSILNGYIMHAHGQGGHYNNSTLHYDCVMDPELKEIHQPTVIVLSASIILFGTIGNLSSIYVLQKQAYKNNFMSCALTYLAVLDTLILWTAVLKLLINGIEGKLREHEGLSGCLLVFTISEILSTIDNWLLVVITITRVISIRYPFKAKTYCSKLNYYGLLVIMHVFSIASMVATMIKLAKYWLANKDEGDCSSAITDQIKRFEKIIHLIVNFLLPCVILLFLDVILVQELKKLEQRQQYLHNQPITTSDQTNNMTLPNIPKALNDTEPNPAMELQQISFQSIPHSSQNVPKTFDTLASNENIEYLESDIKINASSSFPVGRTASWREPIDLDLDSDSVDKRLTAHSVGKKSSDPRSYKGVDVQPKDNDSRGSSLTRILLMASFIFIGINTPFWVFHLFFRNSLIGNPHKGCHFKNLTLDLVALLRWSGHCVNFYFYCATGSRFRQELVASWKGIFRC